MPATRVAKDEIVVALGATRIRVSKLSSLACFAVGLASSVLERIFTRALLAAVLTCLVLVRARSTWDLLCPVVRIMTDLCLSTKIHRRAALVLSDSTIVATDLVGPDLRARTAHLACILVA